MKMESDIIKGQTRTQEALLGSAASEIRGLEMLFHFPLRYPLEQPSLLLVMHVAQQMSGPSYFPIQRLSLQDLPPPRIALPMVTLLNEALGISIWMQRLTQSSSP